MNIYLSAISYNSRSCYYKLTLLLLCVAIVVLPQKTSILLSTAIIVMMHADFRVKSVVSDKVPPPTKALKKMWEVPTSMENASLSTLLKALPSSDCLLAIAKQ